MIEVAVKKTLGTFRVQVQLHDSGFICLSGKNGSGKSTLLRIIAGLLKQDEGKVIVASKDVSSLPLEERGVVLVTPDSYIPHLTVDKHLRWGMRARRISFPEEFFSDVKTRLGITYDGRVDRLSLGMRERVSLATALLSKPQALLVDEAFSNLDDRESFVSTYRQLTREASLDVLFTTQSNDDAGGADHHYHMDKGTSVRLS